MVIPNYLMKCLGYNVILVGLIIILETSTSTLRDSGLSHVGKKSFLSKEHEFLKARPLSSEMKSFISKYKRRSKRSFDRVKRQNIQDKHMYAIRNGVILPLKNLEPPTAVNGSRSSFTVIPLIIPISVGQTTVNRSHTPCSHNCMPNSHGEAPDFPIHARIFGRSGITVDTIEEQEECDENGNVKTAKEKNDDEPVIDTLVSELEPSDTTTLEPTAGALSDTPFTKSGSDKIYLNKVVEDVRGLINFQKQGKTLTNEGSLCTINGDWDSDAGGIQIRIEIRRNDSLNPVIELVEREPPFEGGFLCDGKWNVTGHVPYNHSSVLILTAVSPKRKRIATFIGECRICEETQTIAGDWMVGRGSRNCKDRQESHVYFSDILRKSNIRKLQTAHLREIKMATTTDNDK